MNGKEQGRRAVLAGLGVCAAALVVMLLPLVWGRSSINRYFVAFGLVFFCVGLSFMFHGAWDWWRASR